MVLCHLGLVWQYSDSRFASPPLAPGQVSVVRHIETLGPVWIVGFATTAGGISLALWLLPRLLWLAHVAGAAMLAGYANAAWLGAFLSTPDRPITAAVLGTTLAGVHGLAVWVASRSVR